MLSSSFESSAVSIPGAGSSNLGSSDINQAILNSAANSGPSAGASSLVTGAKSGFSGVSRLQSPSLSTESSMRLPASPISFTSNNVTVSGSLAIESTVQQSLQLDPSSQQASQNQHQQRLQPGGSGPSGATSLASSQMGQILLQLGTRSPSSFMQDPSILSHIQKKPRSDIKQEYILQQPLLQQLLQRQDSMQLPNHKPQLQASIQQQQRLRQQQLLKAMPQLQRAQLQQQLLHNQEKHLQLLLQ